jgi:hypothetical protein
LLTTGCGIHHAEKSVKERNFVDFKKLNRDGFLK